MKAVSKILALSLVWLLALAPAASAQEELSGPLSLEQCIDYALQNNQMIKATEIDKEMANADVKVIRADGLPQVNATASVANNFIIPRVFVPADAFGGGGGAPSDETVALEFGTDFNGDAGISVTQMIFDGSFFVGLQAARTYKELSEKNNIKTRIDVAAAVTKAYYSVLINKELYQLYEDEYRRVQRLHRDVTKMYEQGFSERIDVQRLQVQVNNIATDLKRIGNTLNISYQLLKFQMGLPDSQRIELAGDMGSISPELQIEVYDDFDYGKRIEYSQLQTNQALAQLDLKNNKVKYIPSLNLFMNLGWNTGTNEFSQVFNFDNWVSSGTLGMRLNVPIFDGLRKSYMIQKNKLQIQQIDLYFDQMRNQIDNEISQARAALEVNVENMESQKSNMEMAAEIYEVTIRKYQEGVGTNLEVLDALREKRAAENNYFAAIYDAIIAKVDYDKATGSLYNP